MSKHLILRTFFLLIIVALSVYLFIHFDLHHLFRDREKLLHLIRSYPYDQIIFIIVQIIQVVAAPIPGELTGFIGGYLYGPFWGTLYSTIGLTVGSWIAFMLARFFGEPLVETMVKKEVFEKFDHFMEHRGLLISFLLFLIPGFPKDYLCYIMGVSRIPTGTFIVISTAGRVFGTIMLSVTGNVARNGQYIALLAIFILGVATFIAAYYYHDRILEFLKRRKHH
ncbi:MAG TPA: VTT domain-containing protein [Smithella sp.]|nr:VTT domain-containing protein [Smithella sp.]